MRGLSDLLAASRPEDGPDIEGYEVQRIDEGRAVKDYLCPECGNVVPAGEGHVVVWPVGDSDLRRHWHRHCWRVEVSRSRDAD